MDGYDPYDESGFACLHCNGSGVDPDDMDGNKCPDCDGVGIYGHQKQE